MFQRWHDLLFAHWRAPIGTLRPLVPRALPLDLFEGEAWVAVTPFWMSGVRLRGLPPFPGASRFPELNVRTYVTLDGKPGVYFFSLDAANRLAVAAARQFFRLPYHRARMSAEPFGEGISYRSERDGPPPAAFEGWYAPASSSFQSIPGTLEYFLTERYCLYTVAGDGEVHRVEIDHDPWPLQPARADLRRNTMTAAAGVAIDGDPLLHFAKRLDVRVWAPQPVA
ncbi:MAG: YqjF family protein [Thermoanaerobaculia bacterium]